MRKIIIKTLSVIVLPIYIIGLVFYYLGKLIKAFGYLLSFHIGSAKEELRDFLTVEFDISDL